MNLKGMTGMPATMQDCPYVVNELILMLKLVANSEMF